MTSHEYDGLDPSRCDDCGEIGNDLEEWVDGLNLCQSCWDLRNETDDEEMMGWRLR